MSDTVQAPSGNLSLSPTVGIVSIGIMVGISFALAKFAVSQGIALFSALFWQLFCATIVLLIVVAIKGIRLQLSAVYLRYYLISGLLGVSGPQIIAYVVLKHIPAGLFSTLVTLSPLITFGILSVVDRRFLPLYRLVGIALGLMGVSLATLSNMETGALGLHWILVAIAAPILLASGNVYRNKAYPKGANPLVLATGMLASQTLLVWPIVIYQGNVFSPIDLAGSADVAIVIIGIFTALSYILTFAIQRKTDGVGFSQVGYFATLSGIGAGAVLFGEPLGPLLVVSIAILFVGLAVTNGHFKRAKY